MRGKLRGHGADHAHHGRLGRGVGYDQWNAEERGHRGHEDDVAVLALDHAGEHRLRKGVGAENMRAHHLLQLRGRGVDRGLLEVHAGVVDQAGDGTVGLRDLRDQRRGLVVLGDVMHHIRGALPHPLHRGGELRLAPADEHDARARLMHGLRDGEADARAATGDEDMFGFQREGVGEFKGFGSWHGKKVF